MPTRAAWAEAYFIQASSDWVLFREFLSRPDVPQAQALHYLQMATEKLAKAYRLRDTKTDLDDLLTSHVGFTSFINSYLLSPRMRKQFAGRAHQLEVRRRDCSLLARAVEALAPAVDRSGRPGNAEYPWAMGEAVTIPVRYAFPELELLRTARGRFFLTLLQHAFREYDDQLQP